MKIKIECTQKEFAEIARGCMFSKSQLLDGSCNGCIFHHLCKEETFIEDLAEFKVVKENGNGR